VELESAIGRSGVIKEDESCPQTVGCSGAMLDKVPVDQLEEAHGLLVRTEAASESLESGEVVH